MHKTFVAVLSIAVALSLTAQAADAQLGGLIKKKVGDAVKGGDKTAAKAADDNSSKLPRPLTEGVLTAFEKGLQVEINQRQEVTKFLSTIKTVEQYRACQSGVAASPEAQKIMMSIGAVPSNATTEQMQKIMTKMNEDIAKLSLEKCGEDPQKYNGGWRQEQLTKAERAGAKELAGVGSKPGPALGDDLQSDDDVNFYRLLKEWVTPFCGLSAALQQQAAQNGVKIQGASIGNNYVYTAAEAALLIQLCPALMKLLSQLA